jgi:hypothetical protein
MTSTEWQVINLTTPGWRISDLTVQQITAEIVNWLKK